MKIVLLAIQILIIQIFICFSSAKLLQRKIKCNRKNVVVVTLMFSRGVVIKESVSTSDEKSVFNVDVCHPSVSNKYCTDKVNTIWYAPPCYYQHYTYRLQVKCHIHNKFLKVIGKLHSYSTFGLKVSILQESQNRNNSLVKWEKMIPFTPAMVCCHWTINER